MRSHLLPRQFLNQTLLRAGGNSRTVLSTLPNRLALPPDCRGARLLWRYLEPWTVTEEDVRDPKLLIASIRRGIWEGLSGWKRERNERTQEVKRRKLDNGEEVIVPIYATEFSKEDIENEQRRPKKKVAVLIGYSGTGYKGMQLSTTEKTIEGDLFTALVAAGAISKANAADPKKSSFVRCARTDKGVHAAGNVVSLKLIHEDPDIIQKINEQLSPQIRVWDIVPASKSFSCYQMCDSRIYEYLIPSHSFLPPHPCSYLGGKLVELAEKAGDLDGYKSRQEEVATYWDEIDETVIRPLLETFPEDIRKLVEQALHMADEDDAGAAFDTEAVQKPSNDTAVEAAEGSAENSTDPAADEEMIAYRRRIYETVKTVKAAYLKAKRAYRIPPARLARIQEALNKYVGTRNFWNYTTQKTFKDPSGKRHIKSFKVNPEPIVIDGTEWLSLKVHGQSFMMHQIRKMVSMAALVVRCGCDPDRIFDTYGPTRLAIPKAPGLGLLLERPIFDAYNKRSSEFGKDPIEFDKCAKEMNEFKQREIYDRIFREEEETHAFTSFFNHIDHYARDDFLYITSAGVKAAKITITAGDSSQNKPGENGPKKGQPQEALAKVEMESEGEGGAEEEG